MQQEIRKDYGWENKELDWNRQGILQRKVWEKLNKTDF